MESANLFAHLLLAAQGHLPNAKVRAHADWIEVKCTSFEGQIAVTQSSSSTTVFKYTPKQRK